MRIDILTLFPDLMKTLSDHAMVKRVHAAGQLDIHIHHFRDDTFDKHGRVDDTPYGGGAGMVLQVEPIVRRLRLIENYETATKLVLSPQGPTYDQATAVAFSKKDHLILICGHYEGFDERLLEYVDGEVSIGDYVLNGGEIAAWVIVESVGRLLPGAVNNPASLTEESFSNGLLEYPQYTRPPVFEGHAVPEVLISGHHQNIEMWRHQERLKKTKKNRPDLYLKYTQKNND
jgi:tRNA (guanine37-N1)-methyltransferase